MIDIRSVASDSEAFSRLVEGVVDRSVVRYSAEKVYVVRVRDWFGSRWRRFSGKSLGAVGVRSSKLTIPPFVPARVTSQLMFRRDGQLFVPDDSAKPLHLSQPTSRNLQRWISGFGESVAFFWYSSTEANADRASLLAYLPGGDEHLTWYLGFKRDGGWKVVETAGISGRDLSECVKGTGIATVA